MIRYDRLFLFVLILSVSLWINSYVDYPTEKSQADNFIKKREIVAKNEDRYYGIKVVMGCEYLYQYYNEAEITHKGNCKFCIERNTKIIKEQLKILTTKL